MLSFRKHFGFENFMNLKWSSSRNDFPIFLIVIGFSILQIYQLHLWNQFQPVFRQLTD